jgi:hypothetical protein
MDIFFQRQKKLDSNQLFSDSFANYSTSYLFILDILLIKYLNLRLKDK